MTRLSLMLLIAVLASALYLVHTQYESRRLFVELEKAAAQSRKLEAENESLQVEKRAQATPLRVEKLAKENLQMITATPAITQYVTQKDGLVEAATVRSAGPPQASTAPTGGSEVRKATGVGAFRP
ncbi:MAG: cell division protein FtsL [Polaromonas sp.]|nr:cell division protein FtsL [Polaromonas sp.]